MKKYYGNYIEFSLINRERKENISEFKHNAEVVMNILCIATFCLIAYMVIGVCLEFWNG